MFVKINANPSFLLYSWLGIPQLRLKAYLYLISVRDIMEIKVNYLIIF